MAGHGQRGRGTSGMAIMTRECVANCRFAVAFPHFAAGIFSF